MLLPGFQPDLWVRAPVGAGKQRLWRAARQLFHLLWGDLRCYLPASALEPAGSAFLLREQSHPARSSGGGGFKNSQRSLCALSRPAFSLRASIQFAVATPD